MESRRRGRPPTGDAAKRGQFNTRLREATKAALEEAAKAQGRSLSEEIEHRLERSLEREQTITEAINAHEARGGPNAAFFRLMAPIPGSLGVADTWRDNRADFERVAAAAIAFLRGEAPPTPEETEAFYEGMLREIARLRDPAYPPPLSLYPDEPIEQRRRNNLFQVRCLLAQAARKWRLDDARRSELERLFVEAERDLRSFT